MEKRSARGNWLMLACAGVLLLVCLSILARFLLMQVAVKKLRIEGAWLEPVLGAVYTEYQKSQKNKDDNSNFPHHQHCSYETSKRISGK